MELLSDRLVLRPWADADAPALFELARDPRVGIAAGWPPHESEEQSLDILRNVLRGPEQYAITLREGGQLIGAIGLLTRDSCNYLEADDEYSVGYWIGVPYWGQGFAAEALQRLIDHARNALGARAIYADHFLENAQSHRVMEKCGLSPVRTQAAEVLYPAGRRDILIMRRVLAPRVERSPMHHPMKQLPERAIGEDEAREILRQGEYCVVATVDEDGHPYATPLSYVLDGDELLIHTGVAGGQKTEDWERNPRVCVTVAMDMQPVYVEENGEPGSSPRATPASSRRAPFGASRIPRRRGERSPSSASSIARSIGGRSAPPSSGNCPRQRFGPSTLSTSPARRDDASRTARAPSGPDARSRPCALAICHSPLLHTISMGINICDNDPLSLRRHHVR